jgi:hypothetical protein
MGLRHCRGDKVEFLAHPQNRALHKKSVGAVSDRDDGLPITSKTGSCAKIGVGDASHKMTFVQSPQTLCKTRNQTIRGYDSPPSGRFSRGSELVWR